MKNTSRILMLLVICNAARGSGLLHIDPPAEDKDPAFPAMLQVVKDFGDLQVNRRRLLLQFQAIRTNYPQTRYQGAVSNAIEIMTKEIAEDEAHTPVDLGTTAQLPLGARVRELVFQLRNQNGVQWTMYDDLSGRTNSFLDQLVAIGYPSVPQLIEAVENQMLTRSVSRSALLFVRSHEPVLYTVLSVGDCATRALETIARRKFTRATPAETRSAAEAWWADFQRKGERRMYIEGTEAGNEDSPNQANFLIGHYRSDALPALIKGTRTANQDWIKAALLQNVQLFEASEATDFLLQETETESGVPKLYAASVLNRRGISSGISAILNDWHQAPDQWADAPNEPGNLIVFLASVDFPDAIAHLGRNLMARQVSTRLAVVSAVGKGGSQWHGSPTRERSPKTQAEMEKLLVEALDDTADTGKSGFLIDHYYSNLRICDLSGFWLNKTWPQNYDFNLSGSLRLRDRQRIECQNVWRRKQRLEALPVPADKSNRVPPHEANKVTAIKLEPGTITLTKEFSAKVELFRGSMLTLTNLCDFLAEFAAHPEPAGGLFFQASRDEDLAGVTITVGLLPGPSPSHGILWHEQASAMIGQEPVMDFGSIGPCSTGWANSRPSYEGVAAALAASPDKPFTIRSKIWFTSN